MTQTPASGPVPVHWKLVIDCASPQAQAEFWAAALHYEIEDNDALIQRLLELGALPREATVEFHARLAFRDLIAVRHPDDPYDKDRGTGLGRRLLFQRVPEAKSVKNRLVGRLEGLGASVLRRVKEPAGEWVVMADPEGNEFCVQ